MGSLLNTKRLSRIFISLCEIDSPARSEQKLAQHILSFFQQTKSVEFYEDDSASVTGSDTGNIIIRFPGNNPHRDPIFFNCHLDVISPCIGVKVGWDGKDTFFSNGETVLGADDKAGIAILLEVLLTTLENNLQYAPVELLFTTCEEIGLLGAKAFSPSSLRGYYGYALDSTGVDNVITGAPAANYIIAEIQGKASHAGLHPNNGINAIQLASKAITKLPLGQLDDQSTANIGIISGGTATNIIPDFVQIKGEIRSHSLTRLHRYLDQFKSVFFDTVTSWQDPHYLLDSRPTMSFQSPEQYPLMSLPENSEVIQLAKTAGITLSRPLHFGRAGGGSDANFLNHKGIPTAILGIGMDHVHSTSEQIRLSDMSRTAELVLSILTS
ncbi:MAG: M20/M25/M40 family metallo-hydrolase [Desulfobulbaceae bacterium]|uniref:M20/M25/M40 family metallo-hydrolase n=1 Tax=Candidatus Desulfobia pelagia TaxID=2841692 RepID=A0A8J6NDV0_9BACT|nr:M20/M25/M40 family metallo-hydrolase [Candidatus Desulfobia pelagia]